MKVKICFLGTGNMASAIISGVKSSNLGLDIIVCDHKQSTVDSYRQQNYLAFINPNQAIENSDYVVLSVKPQSVEELSAKIDHQLLNNKVLISIAAGINCSRLQEFFPTVKKIVRVMPNTPCLVNKGVMGIYYYGEVNDFDKKVINDVFTSIGKCYLLNNEDDINKVIAASGSGPAYFFYIFNNMIKALVDLGMNYEQAKEMVIYTADGAISMVEKNSNISLDTLQNNVTSKGGTTQAALEKFSELEVDKSLQAGLKAAYLRAKEMEKLI